ncbi:unnamed protein product [Colias eurytheme]|nr:unnamed protein product [Colias eurytheme]
MLFANQVSSDWSASWSLFILEKQTTLAGATAALCTLFTEQLDLSRSAHFSENLKCEHGQWTYHSYVKGGVPVGSGSASSAALPGAARTVWRPVRGKAGGSMGSSPLGASAPHCMRACAHARSLSINNTKKCNTLGAYFGNCPYDERGTRYFGRLAWPQRLSTQSPGECVEHHPQAAPHEHSQRWTLQ